MRAIQLELDKAAGNLMHAERMLDHVRIMLKREETVKARGELDALLRDAGEISRALRALNRARELLAEGSGTAEGDAGG